MNQTLLLEKAHGDLEYPFIFDLRSYSLFGDLTRGVGCLVCSSPSSERLLPARHMESVVSKKGLNPAFLTFQV